eukprot:NODE_3646_length_646_cov_89.876047_g2610_i0.p4 GENE.NODE_3646_length_646_cov_89.876047_g2610_i0~~NODE_3646_length_646_cov_89.876047_g2610_i0.p4  ORF type:complete len:84 (-),score=2.21 NODE_3646_length_646_cov_89.876047_g2610_i0:290-541(-)
MGECTTCYAPTNTGRPGRRTMVRKHTHRQAVDRAAAKGAAGGGIGGRGRRAARPSPAIGPQWEGGGEERGMGMGMGIGMGMVR